MSQLNDHELEAFEAELRRYKPRSVDALPLSSPIFSGIARWIGAAAGITILVMTIWHTPKQYRQDRRMTVISEPLIEIHADAALARGATVDQLAPLPIVSQQPHGISALEVLSQE